MFIYQLARDLGKTVTELEATMPSIELTRWMAYYHHLNTRTKPTGKGKPKARRRRS